MLDANSPAFRQQYPNGAIVRDRLGRQLRGVFAFDPETGEVIQHDRTKLTGLWVRLQLRLPFRQWWGEAVILRRHGFYPAPLTIEPRQWLHVGFVNH
jgi:hypothetical protein